MWENRPAVPNVYNAPCQNCKNRTAPKTCENTCERWLEYKKKKEKSDEKVRQKKIVTRMFIDIYKDAKNKREKK